MTSSLWSLTQEYKALLTKDELTPEDMIALDDQKGFIEDKVISCACVLNELKAQLHLTSEAIKIAENKKGRIQRNITRLEEYVLGCLVENRIDKIDKHPLFDVKVRQNRASVDDFEPDKIPEEYWVKKETLSLDKVKIKEDIENLGVIIPGVRLVKKLSLRIE